MGLFFLSYDTNEVKECITQRDNSWSYTCTLFAPLDFHSFEKHVLPTCPGPGTVPGAEGSTEQYPWTPGAHILACRDSQ